MKTILNPNPVAANTFDGMWTRNINIVFPNSEKRLGTIQADLLPHDGVNLLALGGKRVTKPLSTADELTNQMLDNLKAEIVRLSGNSSEPKHITVSAQDPVKPVRAVVRFADNKIYSIADCFALASEDAAFAATLNLTLAEIARLAGLQIK